MAKTRDLARYLRQVTDRDPDLAADIEAERFNANVAQEVYRARTEAGLTQGQLADLIGSHQSVIARLEDADYDGHSLKSLRRIAAALGRRVEVRFVTKPKSANLSVAPQTTRAKAAKRKASR